MSAIDVAVSLESPRARRVRLVRKRFLRRPMAVAGLLVVIGFVVMAAAAPWLAPYPPGATDFNSLIAPPSAEHLLGTDALSAHE